jgi:hypothetical protein
MSRAPSWDALSFGWPRVVVGLPAFAVFAVFAAFAAFLVLGAACASKQEPRELEPVLPVRPTAEQETKSVTDVIEASQQAPDAVTAAKIKTAADSVFNRTFGALIAAKLIVGTPRETCFAAGCLFRVVFADRCAQLRGDVLYTSDRNVALLEWPGTIARTPPITVPGSAQVNVTWALYLTPKQYDLLSMIPRPGGTTYPPPVPPCPATVGTAQEAR